MPAVPTRAEEAVAPDLRKGLVASVLLHGLAVLALGLMPKTERAAMGGGQYEEFASVTLEPAASAEVPEPKAAEEPRPEVERKLALEEKNPEPVPVPPEPRRVRLGSPTSPSEAATMTWIGFDEYVEHSGMASEVDQAGFTRDAPGPQGPVPSEGVAAVPGNPVPESAPAPAPTAVVGMGDTEMEGRGERAAAARAAAPGTARASDPAVVIAEEERRPRAEADAIGAARAEVKEVEIPSGAAVPAPVAPPAPARPADVADGERKEAVEASVPAPASLAKEVKRQEREEIAAPAVSGAPGEKLVVPQKGVEGAKDEPEFDVGEKRVEVPKDANVRVGPEVLPVKAQAPAPAEEAKAEAAKDALTPPEPEARPVKAASDRSISEGEFSQGPKVDERLDESGAQEERSERRERADVPAGGRPAEAGIPSRPRAGTGREGIGVPSDRESVASAIKKAVTLEKWGQPLVARGLKVKTVRPKLSKYTQITASGSPVIRIGFDRKGRARDVIVLQSSGVPDVDRPVVDAAYQWTAEGQELEELRENPPETVTIDVRVIR